MNITYYIPVQNTYHVPIWKVRVLNVYIIYIFLTLVQQKQNTAVHNFFTESYCGVSTEKQQIVSSNFYLYLTAIDNSRLSVEPPPPLSAVV